MNDLKSEILEIEHLEQNNYRLRLINTNPPYILENTVNIQDYVLSQLYSKIKNINNISFINKQYIKETGELIFNILNGKDSSIIKQIFSNNNCVTLNINNNFLKSIPFELAYNSNCFLCMIKPISHGISNFTFSENKLSKPRADVVIIADPGHNLDNAYHEGENIFNILKKQIYLINKIEFISNSLSIISFIEIINKFDIVYFVGHGNYDKNNIYSLQIGKDNYISDKDFEHSFSSPPQLMIINSCYSGYSEGYTSSLAEKLLRKGVSNIISTGFKMIDLDFSNFMSDFVRHYLAGSPIGIILMRMIYNNYKTDDLHWIYPRLFGNPLNTI